MVKPYRGNREQNGSENHTAHSDPPLRPFIAQSMGRVCFRTVSCVLGNGFTQRAVMGTARAPADEARARMLRLGEQLEQLCYRDPVLPVISLSLFHDLLAMQFDDLRKACMSRTKALAAGGISDCL